MESLVPDPSTIRLAMLGMVDGNQHPYSWSAIFNGYERQYMKDCPSPHIPKYLFVVPERTPLIHAAKVTHIWTDSLAEADHVALSARIPNVVRKATDVIGQVDAVIIATDKGFEHAERARPFVEAGLPLFIDKPLVDREGDLQLFNGWVGDGAAILSSSCMRYAREFIQAREHLSEVGDVRYVSMSTAKSWDRYGIHALEGIYPLLGPGFLSARNTGAAGRDVVHLKHSRGIDVIVPAIADMYGGFCRLSAMGTRGALDAAFSDTLFSFKSQLETFVEYLRTGVRPFPWAETVELMKLIIAGIRSRDEGGREVFLAEIHERPDN
jgi:hypothetical protein